MEQNEGTAKPVRGHLLSLIRYRIQAGFESDEKIATFGAAKTRPSPEQRLKWHQKPQASK